MVGQLVAEEGAWLLFWNVWMDLMLAFIGMIFFIGKDRSE